MSESEDMRRIGMNDEADVDAHALRRVNEEATDEARREDDEDDVEAHLKKA